MLYVVSTPIGNLKDITYRAIEVLQSSDIVLSEDTRRTGKLLKHYSIKKKQLSYNDQNKLRRIPYVIQLLQDGNDIALCSDAGTPGIADPGYRLITECVSRKIQVVPIPGASSLLAGLIPSGFPTDTFEFIGWLPKKKGQKQEILKNINRTTVCFESPYRIEKTLVMIAEVNNDLRLCIGRELTKVHEEYLRGSASEILELIKKNKRKLKGEITLVLAPKGKDKHAQC